MLAEWFAADWPSGPAQKTGRTAQIMGSAASTSRKAPAGSLASGSGWGPAAADLVSPLPAPELWSLLEIWQACLFSGQSVEQLFREVDLDGSGFIDPGDVRGISKMLGMDLTEGKYLPSSDAYVHAPLNVVHVTLRLRRAIRIYGAGNRRRDTGTC